MDDDLDDVIDRAVRELMSAEPRSDLRRRVLIELDRRQARSWVLPRYAAAGALAALSLTAAALFIDRPAPSPATSTLRSEPPAGVPAPPATESREALARPAPPVPPARVEKRSVRPRQRPASQVTATAAEAQPEPLVTVAPLAQLAEITVARVDPAAVAMPEIAIAPLAQVNDVVVKPLYPPDGRK